MAIGCKINLNYKRPAKELVEALKEFPVANIESERALWILEKAEILILPPIMLNLKLKSRI